MRSLFLLLGLIVATVASADDVTVSVRAPKEVAVGSRFQVSFVVSAAASDITRPEFDGFKVLMGPSTSSSSSYEFVNGRAKSSRQTIFTYVVAALKEGNLTIAPAKVKVGNETYQSEPHQINVVAGQQEQTSQQSQSSGSSSSRSSNVASNGKDIFVTLELSRSSVYEGEGVTLSAKVYTRLGVQQVAINEMPKLSEFLTEEATSQHVTFEHAIVDGRQYTVGEFMRKILVPQKSGKIVIDPIEAEFTVRTPSQGAGGFFDSFFNQMQLSQVRVKSKPVTINVKKLPKPAPAGFNGGVGQYKFDVSVSPTDVQVDNSVQVKLSVEGTGNIKVIGMPKPQFHQDFDTFDPSVKEDLRPCSAGHTGRRTDEYLAIPRRDGTFEIPQISFAYFDPAKGSYVTINKGPFTINVAKSDGSQSSQSQGVTFSGSGPEQVTYLGSDLRYLHRSGDLAKRGSFFVLSPLFWLLTILPLIGLGALAIVARKREFDSANRGLVLSRKANKAAAKRLRGAQKFIKDGKREAFYDEVMRALWGYLSDKLTMPLSELTKDNAKEKMAQHGLDAEASDEFMALLDECEFARYAPAAVSGSMDDVYAKAVSVIGKIESNKKK